MSKIENSDSGRKPNVIFIVADDLESSASQREDMEAGMVPAVPARVCSSSSAMSH